MPFHHFFYLFWKLLALASMELKLPELADLCSYTASEPHAIMGLFFCILQESNKKDTVVDRGNLLWEITRGGKFWIVGTIIICLTETV